ncbi:MAG: AraC family transcriptional regulator [Janthinobacterium lividum]
MPGDITILFRGSDQCPLGQVIDAAFVHRSTGITTHRVLGFYALIFIIDGQGTYTDANHKPTPVSAGDLFVLFPDVAHRYGPSRSSRWDEIYISFRGPIFDLWRQVGLLAPERSLFRLGETQPWVERFSHVADVPETEPSKRQIIMVGRLQAVLADIVTSQQVSVESDAFRWLTDACHLLESELAEEIDCHWVAETVGFSYDRFRKKFAKEIGMTPYQYRSSQRLGAGRKMLLETEMSLKEIAASVGFFDEFAFSNRFKQAFGLSPRAFRQEAHSPQKWPTESAV